jgi:hypothetical protein
MQVPLPPGCPVLLDVLFARHTTDTPSANPNPAGGDRDQQQQQQQLPVRKVLHVQSVSDWAPSCIGPYSQVCYSACLQVVGDWGRHSAGTKVYGSEESGVGGGGAGGVRLRLGSAKLANRLS